ncbi:FAD-dependent oxidoreductase [Bacillus taeanensis]|uniref:Pyridine nucleotide-disulfide oxidoreductase n=1 Tax=Bacillus taeanensis TaxID=273032 RepID=A0A366XXU7_9BACI|nr:FAD-dependent oxidoreductase [Bacillus taeanensis]RBW70388.1 pyridine nucleotide-disulfide oxidoreductase [Bacillus taeanensis]
MKKLLLVGGGHAHLHIIKMLEKESLVNTEITLISPSRFHYYSGMFSGFTEGLYSEEEIRIDLKKLAEKAAVNWIEAAVLSVDPEQKMVLTTLGDVLTYDVLSFDIGSLTAGTDLQGVLEHVKCVKPNYQFSETIKHIREKENIVVVGGGAAGVEISLSLAAYRKHNKINGSITLVSSSELLPEEQNQTVNKITKLVKEKGVRLLTNKKINKVTEKHLHAAGGEAILYDEVLWLAGPKAPKIFQVSNLPTDENGYLLVENTLQVKKYPSIFGTGDCAALNNYPSLPKTGVYAVREAPVLYRNIKGFLTDGAGEYFKPQKDFLSILSIGNREGFLLYKGRAFHGKWAWLLKNKIDKRFIKPYQ